MHQRSGGFPTPVMSGTGMSPLQSKPLSRPRCSESRRLSSIADSARNERLNDRRHRRYRNSDDLRQLTKYPTHVHGGSMAKDKKDLGMMPCCKQIPVTVSLTNLREGDMFCQTALSTIQNTSFLHTRHSQLITRNVFPPLSCLPSESWFIRHKNHLEQKCFYAKHNCCKISRNLTKSRFLYKGLPLESF